MDNLLLGCQFGHVKDLRCANYDSSADGHADKSIITKRVG